MEKSAGHTLRRNERLRTLGAIRRMFDQGESGFLFPFRYVWFAEADTQNSVRILFSVPKRFHKRANKRNLLRRRTKEAYRLHKELLAAAELPAAIDLALVYSSKELLDYAAIERAVGTILSRIAGRCREE